MTLPQLAYSPHTPPTTPGACATLACIWEATAPKPGNVYRGADFEDVGYVDFLTSAVVVGPLLERAAKQGVGRSVRAAVEATESAVGTNTNLGMLLLLAPLAAVPADQNLSAGIKDVLSALSHVDTAEVYTAIRIARPGGLGEVDQADINSPEPPTLTLVEVMRLAAPRDSIARQYVSGFDQVFGIADQIDAALRLGSTLSDAIVHAYMRSLAQTPDSLIARKCGDELAREVSHRASAVLDRGGPGDVSYEQALGDFDFWLRSDGHRRNPGTTADLIAGALFVLLRDERIAWPVRFDRRPQFPPQEALRRD